MVAATVAFLLGGLALLAGWFALQVHLLKAALAAYERHCPGDALRLARRCLALRPVEALHPLAHQALGLASSALGDLAGAERSFREAMRSPVPAHQARSAVLLAGLAHREGRLAEARELLLRGREVVSVRRDAGVGLVELALSEGDFDRARLELQGARAALPLPAPERERTSQGLLRFLGALVELEDDRPAEARRLLDEAAPDIAGIPLLAFRAEVARAMVDAMERPASALPALRDVESRLPVCGEDRTARLAAELMLARGYVLAGAADAAERLLRGVLASDPPGVTLPQVHGLLADCALARNDVAAARRSLEAAAAPGVETRHARAARQRLAELPGES